jgi:hypothetical protein
MMQFINTPGSSVPGDADTAFNAAWNNGGGKFGASHVSPETNNGVVMEFAVQPSGIGSEPDIGFDITRQKESIWWDINDNTVTEFSGSAAPSSFPSQNEEPNDDEHRSDEDNNPQNNHIYSLDMPGFTSDNADANRSVARFNFYEFVRVRFDGNGFSNNNGTIEGSRSSPKVAWRSRMDVVDNGGTWDRNPDGDNEIELDHQPLLPDTDASIGNASGAPGASVQADRSITNNGTDSDVFRWTVTKTGGAADITIVDSSRDKRIGAGATDNGQVEIQIDNSASSGETAAIEIEVKVGSEVVASDTATITVETAE